MRGKNKSPLQDLLEASEQISNYLIILRRNAKNIADSEQARLIESMCAVIERLQKELCPDDLQTRNPLFLNNKRLELKAEMLNHLYVGITKPSFEAPQAFLDPAIKLCSLYNNERKRELFIARVNMGLAVINLLCGIAACIPPATPIAALNFTVAAINIISAIHHYNEVAKIDKRIETFRSKGNASIEILGESYRGVNDGNASVVAKERIKAVKELDEQNKDIETNEDEHINTKNSSL